MYHLVFESFCIASSRHGKRRAHMRIGQAGRVGLRVWLEIIHTVLSMVPQGDYRHCLHVHHWRPSSGEDFPAETPRHPRQCIHSFLFLCCYHCLHLGRNSELILCNIWGRIVMGFYVTVMMVIIILFSISVVRTP